MKLQVLDSRVDQSQGIENYKIVRVSDQGLDLHGVSDNECEEILAPDFCDSVPMQNILDGIQILLKKLRLGGTIVIGGTDVRAYAKAVLGGAIDFMTAASLINNARSFTNLEMTRNTLSELGLQVIETHINGIHYEVKCVRSK